MAQPQVAEIQRIYRDVLCDGLFLMFSTAEHNGFRVEPRDVTEHLNECHVCRYEFKL